MLDELKQWLDEKRGIIPPRTALGKALGYLHRQWKRLVLFLGDGNIEATNNRRERELRRLILGRKNWLFTWLDEGGDRVANIVDHRDVHLARRQPARLWAHAKNTLVDKKTKNKDRLILALRILTGRPVSEPSHDEVLHAILSTDINAARRVGRTRRKADLQPAKQQRSRSPVDVDDGDDADADVDIEEAAPPAE